MRVSPGPQICRRRVRAREMSDYWILVIVIVYHNNTYYFFYWWICVLFWPEWVARALRPGVEDPRPPAEDLLLLERKIE